MPRLPLWERPVTYAAVGATQAADLLVRPPAGFRPFRARVRIGHGDDRWRHAWTTVLSWGIQTKSGFRVDLSDAPAAVTDQTYVPVSFDLSGAPVASAVGAHPDEVVFGPDGTPFVTPGVTASLARPFGPFTVSAPARVVYVIDEPQRCGFAYGTLRGHPESGEESFIVEQTDDGSVWLEISGFSRPANAVWWLAYPLLRISQTFYIRRYFEALSGPIALTDPFD
jgi:uncharacterized protein (UPF0548 family)